MQKTKTKLGSMASHRVQDLNTYRSDIMLWFRLTAARVAEWQQAQHKAQSRSILKGYTIIGIARCIAVCVHGVCQPLREEGTR